MTFSTYGKTGLPTRSLEQATLGDENRGSSQEVTKTQAPGIPKSATIG